MGQTGFSAIEGVIALFAVVALSLGGWWVASRHQASKPTTPAKVIQKAQPKQQAADPTEGGKYLVIKEWGVRFPLSDELKGGVKYGILTYDDSDGQIAYFVSQKLASKAPGGPAIFMRQMRVAGMG